ncbi:MAG: hypothetical protein A2512_06445 [Deltaproteobacteria bacterium RIFOXYD12_FULL_56_24]|nr:MAG: hypothetical protein A2512_06445 [Deltaproteobacteria bacterium RIFOXYD12_FULL_56_24]
MGTKVGLWIDQRKAVIVLVSDLGEEVRLILSGAEKHARRSDDSARNGPYQDQQRAADDQRQRIFTALLNTYYDAVIASFADDAESILIFGPGEAKDHLKTRLEENKLGKRLVGIEAADKMTDGQITAKVRQYFAG